ncbi:MAG: hypothetical protein Q9207_005757 [Kuettlingeria erythrocarpa]
MADRATIARRTRTTVSHSPAQSPPPEIHPKRSQRVTRSQSRDINDSDVERKSVHQRATRKAQGTSEDRPVVGSKQRKGKTTRNDGPAILQDWGRVIDQVADCPALADLPEVDETPLVDYPELPQKSLHDVQQAHISVNTHQRRSRQRPESPGGASTYSGTTARISESVRRLSGSRPEDMINELGELSEASRKILVPLIPDDVSEASIQHLQERLLDANSEEARQVRRKTPNFKAHREAYGADRFINVPDVVRVILDVSKLDDVRLGPRRMYPVLYQANLASLITALLAQRGGELGSVQGELVRSFPRPFLERFVSISNVEAAADASALLWETLRLGINIRTRIFIDTAKSAVNEKGFDPDRLLFQTFYKNSSKLRGWNVAGLRSEDIDINKDFKVLIINRLDHLRETFSDIPESLIDLDSLENDFSHVRILTAVVRWSQLRLREIRTQLERVQDVAGIVEAIQSAKGDRRLPRGTMDEDLPRGNDAHGLVPNFDQPSHSPQPDPHRLSSPKSKNLAPESIANKLFTFHTPKAWPRATARLKQREASKRLSGAPAQSDASPKPAPTVVIAASAPQRTKSKKEAPSDTPPSWQAPEDTQPSSPNPVDRTAEAEEIIHAYEALEAENNKENRPIQAQPPVADTSMRKEHPSKKRSMIDLMSDSQAQPNTESRPSSPQVSEPRSTKKSRPPAQNVPRRNNRTREDLSSSDGEDFQEDTRALPQQRRPKSASEASRSKADPQRAAKRRKEASRNQDADEVNDLEDVLERHNDANAPAPSQIENYVRVNALAKRRTAMRPKRVQTRTAWSAEETERLLDLIVEYGLSWSLLKKMDKDHPDGELLATRDQVALKDKARNLKADYLKQVAPLYSLVGAGITDCLGRGSHCHSILPALLSTRPNGKDYRWMGSGIVLQQVT